MALTDKEFIVNAPEIISPTPWEFDPGKNGYIHIMDCIGQPVIPDWDINEDPSVGIFCNADSEVANFKYIVKAVNNHTSMLGALKYAIKALETARDENVYRYSEYERIRQDLLFVVATAEQEI